MYRRALDLPPAKDCDTDALAPTTSDWRLVYERFVSLPINFYAVVDPLALPGGEAETGDVADDLADIWSDLRVGLALHNTGRVDDAMREWRSRFDTHWAQHAAEALHALQSWARKHA